MPKDTEEQDRAIEAPQPLDLFKIQFTFASKVSEIMNIPIEEALLKYTTFYKRIGNIDWDHDPNNPKWQEYLEKLRKGEGPAEAAYSIYMEDFVKSTPNKPKTCFSYSYEEGDGTVSIHFRNNFASTSSPLSKDNIPARRKELVDIFREIKQKHPNAKKVKGGSWLYSYESYRRLFPPEYSDNIEEERAGFKGNAIWGQFLTSLGEMNCERTEQFLEAINKVTTVDELFDAFPVKFYKATAPIGCFYDFFEID